MNKTSWSDMGLPYPDLWLERLLTKHPIGSGDVIWIARRWEKDLMVSVECEFCEGAGQLLTQGRSWERECPQCGGTGQVEKPVGFMVERWAAKRCAMLETFRLLYSKVEGWKLLTGDCLITETNYLSDDQEVAMRVCEEMTQKNTADAEAKLRRVRAKD